MEEEWDLVLFFHADRCSTCNVIDQDIIERWVPDGLTIYKVDFDKEKDLLEKYNVLTQSSFAQIDTNGALIKRRVGWFWIDDIVQKLEDTETKPREAKRQEVQMIDTSKLDKENADTSSLEVAYFAGWCFWCLEWPYEAMAWVKEAISWYMGGLAETANYAAVWSGKTKHREWVQVTYDPSLVTFDELVQTFRYQIDPTDAWGQFADRGYQYTTAIYVKDEVEKSIAEKSKYALQNSGKFDEDIAVLIEPFTTFFPAEQEHQDYYLKQSAHYNRYKKWSWRAGYIEDNWKEKDWESADIDITTPKQDKFKWWIGEAWLDDLQRKVIFEQGTEPPFNNKYWDHKEAWIYVDILDGTPLFSSTDKFESGTWRPSFTTPIDQLLIALEEDRKYGMIRTEVETKNDTHLGHVFNDGPGGKQRYCINSAALDFVSLDDMEEMWYGEYVRLFEK